MIISAIVARASNRVIGKNNDLPWHLPEDLKWFKKHTLGRHIIMGRKSFESIPRPLPKRVNIVVTRDKGFYHSGVHVVHSIDQALELAHRAGESEAFILGGGHIYEQTKDLWDRLYLTEVHGAPEGDTMFPQIDKSQYEVRFEEHHTADDRHDYDYSFLILERKKGQFASTM